MIPQSQEELENTERKLRATERLYEKYKADAAEKTPAREQSLLSLGRLIKRLKEDIARYQARCSAPRAGGRLENQQELENTKKKLVEVERLYARNKDEPEDSYARKLTQRSLKHLINQLKEEIIRFEAKSPVKAK